MVSTASTTTDVKAPGLVQCSVASHIRLGLTVINEVTEVYILISCISDRKGNVNKGGIEECNGCILFCRWTVTIGETHGWTTGHNKGTDTRSIQVSCSCITCITNRNCNIFPTVTQRGEGTRTHDRIRQGSCSNDRFTRHIAEV